MRRFLFLVALAFGGLAATTSAQAQGFATGGTTSGIAQMTAPNRNISSYMVPGTSLGSYFPSFSSNSRPYGTPVNVPQINSAEYLKAFGFQQPFRDRQRVWWWPF